MPSGPWPGLIVATNSIFSRSKTPTFPACMRATKARLPSGWSWMPTGVPSAFTRLISLRVLASMTINSPAFGSETSTLLPSGVNFTRIGICVSFTTSFTLLVAVSMIEMPPSSLWPTHSSLPSGETSIASGCLPTAICTMFSWAARPG